MFPPDYDPKGVGENSEAQILAQFLKHGKVVLTPFGDNQRYDLVVDEGGNFIRVQCKTGLMDKRLKGEAFLFSTCSSNWYAKTYKTYEGEADVFAVYLRETDTVYSVPVQNTPKKTCTLRFTKGKRKKKTTKMAVDHEFVPDRSLLDYPAGTVAQLEEH